MSVINLYKKSEPTGEILFQNNGEIDVNAIITLGVSVKEVNSIGFFGTGLKFSIATLLRNNCKIVIYSGLEKLEFTKKPTTIRGKEFNLVCLNGKELGFTTELGKTWELWQAYREIYCNCIDEGGDFNDTVEGHDPQKGMTQGELLREWRKRNDLTQVAISSMIGCTQQMYQKYETNKSTLPAYRAKKLARLYGITIEELLTE